MKRQRMEYTLCLNESKAPRIKPGYIAAKYMPVSSVISLSRLLSVDSGKLFLFGQILNS